MKAGELHELRERLGMQVLDVRIGVFTLGQPAPMSRDHATHLVRATERSIVGQMIACARITFSPL